MDVTKLIEKFNEELEKEMPGYKVNELNIKRTGINEQAIPKIGGVTNLCWRWDSNLNRYVPC